MHEPDESVNCFLFTFEHSLDRPVPAILDPAVDTMLLREPTHRIAEEDSLHPAVNGYTPADHRRILG